MRHSTIRIYITLFLTIAVQTIFLIRVFFFYPEEQIPSQIYQYIELRQPEKKNWPQKIVDDPTALFTLMLTIFTFGLYLATRSLWSSTDRLVKSAEENSERQLRAYVFPDEARFELRQRHGNNFAIAMCNIKNSGQTPAYDVSISGGIFLGTHPLNDPGLTIPAPNQNRPRGFIAPNGYNHLIEELQSGFISNEVAQSIISGENAIYFAGVVIYKDAFNKNRYTRFCFVRNENVVPGPMGLYREHNEAN